MTCIVGLVEEGTVYIGGDRAVSTAYGTLLKAQPKVYKRGDFLIGGAGTSIIIQVMSHIATIPPIYEGQDPLEYIINNFVPCLRDAIKEVGQLGIDEDNTQKIENFFLIGFRGRLFRIGNKLDVLESLDDIMAIGSGAVHALGALYAINKLNPDLDPEDKIKLALESAEKYDEYVKRPFEIQVLSKYENDPNDVLDSVLKKANELMEKED